MQLFFIHSMLHLLHDLIAFRGIVGSTMHSLVCTVTNRGTDDDDDVHLHEQL